MRTGDEVDPAEGGKPNLAARLDRLFDVMRKQNEPPLSNAAAAAAITKQTGVSISPAYLWQLRSGLKDNPTVTHLRAIAEFFGVPPSYLIDGNPDPNLDAQLTMLQAMRDSGIRDLARRASGLTPAALNSLSVVIDHIRQLEQLPPIAPHSTDPRT